MQDLVGRRFHDLLVISFLERKNGRNYWLCRCCCGNEKTVRGDHLISGATHSCGCKKTKQITEMNKTNKKHGMRYSRIYNIWCGIKDRCENSNYHNYNDYGGRGIKICEDWRRDFVKFYEWAVKNGYKSDLTIDRINVNGDYCPENCRWVSMKVQENNKRNNRVLTYKGRSQTITQWSEEIGINRETLYGRIRRGWDVEKTLTTPVK